MRILSFLLSSLLLASVASAGSVHKFGQSPSVAGGTPEDVWDCPELQAAIPEVYVFPTSAMTLYIASSDDTDAETINVQGLDENWRPKNVTVTLTGHTAIQLDGTWMRVFRAKNTDSSALAGNVYISNTAAHVSGVPTDASEVKACIRQGKGQTLMAIYTVPARSNALMHKFCASAVNAATQTTERFSRFVLHEIDNSSGTGVRQTKHTFSILSHGTTSFCREYPLPRSIGEKTDIIIHNTGEHSSNVESSASFDLWVDVRP